MPKQIPFPKVPKNPMVYQSIIISFLSKGHMAGQSPFSDTPMFDSWTYKKISLLRRHGNPFVHRLNLCEECSDGMLCRALCALLPPAQERPSGTYGATWLRGTCFCFLFFSGLSYWHLIAKIGLNQQTLGQFMGIFDTVGCNHADYGEIVTMEM